MKDKYKILQKYKIDTSKILSKNLDRPVVRGITIDNDNAFFLDDGISISRDKSNYILKVSVTDVSECIEKNSILDNTARKILCENPENMLFPGKVKENCFSLNIDKINLSITVEIHIDNKFNIKKSIVYKSAFISNYNYSYKEIDDKLKDKPIEIKRLTNLAKGLYFKRTGEITELDSPNILKEIIILANSQIAIFCKENNIPVIYENKDPKCYNKYTTEVRPYTTFSSPMRKYLDIIVQRQIKSFINAKKDNKNPNYYSKDFLSKLCIELNEYNCQRNYNFAIKKGVYTALKQKKTITNEIIEKIKHEIEHERIEHFMLYYIIFSNNCDINTKRYFLDILKKNKIRNWYQSLFTFISSKTNLYIYVENPTYSKQKINQKRYREKISEKKTTLITLTIKGKSFTFYGKKKGSDSLSIKAMEGVMLKIYKYVIENNENIFLNYDTPKD